MDNTNFIKWITLLSLRSLGIFDNHLYCIISRTMMTISMSISVFGSVVGFLNSTETVDILESFATISPQLNILLMFLSVNSSCANVLDLLAKSQDYECNAKITDRMNSSFKSKLIWLAIIMVFQTSCFIISGWLYSLQQDSIDDKYSFIVPYWFSCGSQTSNSIFQLVCWKIEKKEFLFAINALQMGGVIIFNTVYFSAFTLYMTSVEELAKHLEYVRSKLNGLSKKIHKVGFRSLKSKCSKSADISSEKEIHRELILIYNHQQILNRHLLKTISTWRGFITFFFVNFCINATLFIFVVFFELGRDKIAATKISSLGLALLATGFILTNYAEYISHVKQVVFDELGKVPWYKMNVKCRKIYLLMLTLNCIPMPVKIADMYEINLNSFGSMMKATYSICNVLILKFVK